MRKLANLLVAACIAAAVVLSGETAVFAPAALLSSDPADGAVLAASPETVRLHFNEPISPLAASLLLPDGRSVPVGALAANGEQLEIRPSAPLPRGTSVVSWRVVSADGHPVGGALTLSVGEPSGTRISAATGDPVATGLIWLIRSLLYAALFFGCGGAFFCKWIGGPALSPAPARAGALIAASGLWLTPLAFGLQGVDALGTGLADLLDASVWKASAETSYATTLALAVAALICALASLRLANSGRALSLVALLLAGAALATSGHASSAEPQWLMRPAVFIHAVGIAFWAGALPGLLAASANAEIDFATLLRRFSAIAVPAVALLALAGAALAAVQLGQLSSLWSTTYGLVLSAKLFAVAALLVLALLNRFRWTPAVERGQPEGAADLRASIRGEMILMLAIFGLVALWRFTPPPRALLQAAAEPARLHLHTQKAMADITLTPGRAGPVAASVAFETGDFEALIPKEATIAFSKPDSGVEPIERKLRLGADGLWRSDPAPLAVAGIWTVRIEALISDFDLAVLQDRVVIDR